jgi:hypothetical protein
MATPPTMIVPPPASGGGLEGDRNRLVWMLQTIQAVLDLTVRSNEPPIPQELRQHFLDTWPEVESSINEAVQTLNSQFAALHPLLEKAGMTGSALEMKAASMYYHSERYVGDVIKYPAKRTIGERIAKLFRPACKVMNSIMGSLKAILPALEIAKEYKEHVEAAADAIAEKE